MAISLPLKVSGSASDIVIRDIRDSAIPPVILDQYILKDYTFKHVLKKSASSQQDTFMCREHLVCDLKSYIGVFLT